MQRVEKGEFNYLTYKKKLNLTIMIAAFAVVFAVLIIGIIIFGNKNNIMTVASVVLVLPAAKFAVAYFVLIPHKNADKALADVLTNDAGNLTVIYDCIFSNNKSPIGTLAAVMNDYQLVALTTEDKADIKLFETSVTEFLKNDKLNVNVTLYKDEKTFLNRVKSMSASFDVTDSDKCDRMGYIHDSIINMCL